jgi:hypothetical protein
MGGEVRCDNEHGYCSRRDGQGGRGSLVPTRALRIECYRYRERAMRSRRRSSCLKKCPEFLRFSSATKIDGITVCSMIVKLTPLSTGQHLLHLRESSSI